MLPTLQVGDFIVVNKYTYGLRLPITGTKILPINKPQRGDVMVFKYPHNKDVKYIKRVIGLPGDEILYINKQLFINGVPALQESMGKAISSHHIVREQLDDRQHLMWRMPGNGQYFKDTVPADHYFMMGDNRDGSNDSRRWGFVAEDLIVGRAVAIWMQWKTFFNLPNFNTVGIIE
jgi:signal peptidase I